MKTQSLHLEEAILYIDNSDIKSISKAAGLSQRSIQSVVYGTVKRSKCVPILIEYAKIKKEQAIKTAQKAHELKTNH